MPKSDGSPTTGSTARVPLEGARLERVYDAWRRIAHRIVRQEPEDLTFEATEIANQAYLKIGHVPFKDTHHAIAAGAQAMRRFLLSHARRGRAAIHGGGAVHVPLVNDSGSECAGDPDWLDGRAPSVAFDAADLEDAMRYLERVSERLYRVVRLRYTEGLTVEEVAATLGVSEPTVKRDWARARAILLSRLYDQGATA